MPDTRHHIARAIQMPESRGDRFERHFFEVLLFVSAAVVGLVLMFAFSAQAQTPGTEATVDPAMMMKQLFDAIAHGHWAPAAALAVSLLTWAVRKGMIQKLLPEGAVKTWLLEHPAVGYATPYALAAVGAILSAVIAGQPWTAGLAKAMEVGLEAVGIFIGAKTVAESMSAGKAAAAKVDTKAEAMAELGPKP